MSEETTVVEGSEGAVDTEPTVDYSTGESSTPDVSEETPEASSAEEGDPGNDAGEEVLPFGKHPRWQKQLDTNRTLASQVKELTAKYEAAQGPMNLDKWIRNDPEGFHEWFKTQLPNKVEPGSEEDPYADFEPEVADRFKRYDAALDKAEQREKEFEQQSVAKQKAQVEENQGNVDEAYEGLIKESGYVDEKGVGNDDFLDVLADATLARLTAIAKNPRLPTIKELKTAYDSVTKGLTAVSKMQRKQEVSEVPPSGSRSGTAPDRKTSMTDDERVLDIAKTLGG